jgi:hypothetical protein
LWTNPFLVSEEGKDMNFKLAILAMTLIATSFAAPITGQLSITGDASVSATTLMYLCDLFSPFTCPANTGQMEVTGLQTGSFVPLANTPGNIKWLSASTTPLNQTFALTNFMTFQADPNTRLDLSFIFLGTGTPCQASGNTGTCTPELAELVTAANPLGKSPFDLTNTPTGSTAEFAVLGNTRNVATGETARFNGVFSATFVSTPGTTDQDVDHILARLAAPGFTAAPYAAQFVATTSPVPEPATWGMLLGGAALLALRKRSV